jgi:ATP-binding cassette subfamily B multidrug efflux pump
MMRPQERAKDRRSTLRRVWGYLRMQKWALIIVTLLVAVSSGIELLGPYLLGRAIDDFIARHDLLGLGRTALMMIGVYLVSSSATYMQTYIMSAAAQRTIRDIRTDLFGRLQELPLRYFDQRTHGELMSRLANDVENISNVLNDSVIQLISSALSIIGVATVMILINVNLALVSMITIPFMVIISQWVARRTRGGFRETQAKLGDLNGIIEETVTGQRVVKAYGQEGSAFQLHKQRGLCYRGWRRRRHGSARPRHGGQHCQFCQLCPAVLHAVEPGREFI